MTLHAPLLAQNGTYDARALRQLVDLQHGFGVVGDGDLKVTQRGAGANMSVDVAAGRAIIPNSTATRGNYLCRSDAVTNVAIAAAPTAPNSRIDLIVARVYDTEYGDGSDTWEIVRVAGTPATSPVPPALPAGSIYLAQVTVGSDVASITNAAIGDLRYYATAVTYSDNAPLLATAGQLLVRTTGQIVARTGFDWISTPMSSQFKAGVTAIGSTALTATSSAYGTTTLTQPPGSVHVFADATGAFGTGSSNGVCEFIVEISIDGGSTWTAGPTVTEIAETNVTPRSIHATHLRSNVSPSGTVCARVMARRTTAQAVTVSAASVRCWTTPAS